MKYMNINGIKNSLYSLKFSEKLHSVIDACLENYIIHPIGNPI